MTQPANPDPITRARQLATDYQANPTPARAHNAAQTLGAVLDTLEATIARTFAITDENDRLHAAELACQLFGRQGTGRDLIGKAATQAYLDWSRLNPPRIPDDQIHQLITELADRRDKIRAETRERLATQLDMPPLTELPEGAANHWTTVDQAQSGQLCDFAEGAGIGFTDADKPTPQQLADLVAKHLTPPKICPGFPVAEPHYARAACFLPEGHPGDHCNQPLATGGIVDPTTIHRIGE